MIEPESCLDVTGKDWEVVWKLGRRFREFLEGQKTLFE